ncbi:MAG TPA: M1 family aminopeptidase [Thermoanaerobaculia bacterium]|nr:M1 family aminopeptidase [Thermoanaerobaculia bacterium]
MLSEIVRFEWRYHTRQVSFVAASLLFFVFGFAVTATGFGPDNIHIDSPFSIAESTGLLSLLSVFILAVFCANAIVRDREFRLEELFFASPVQKFPFLIGRFTGSFLAAFTAFCASTLGMLAARFLAHHDADRLGHPSVLDYLWPLLVIALPNMLFAAVLLFALATLTRSVLASYAASVALYVLYFIGAALTDSPLMAGAKPGAADHATAAALLDPFALSAFFEQTRHWTPALRNTQLLALSGNFLLNRLLWIAASLALLALVYRLFSFRVVRDAKKPRTTEPEPLAELPPYTPVEPDLSNWRAFLSQTKLEIHSFILSRPFVAMALLWAAFAAFEVLADVTGGEYGSQAYPTALLIFDALRQPLTLLALILIIYTSTEMVWRERAFRVSLILNATPSSNAVFIGAKCTALAALVATLTGIGFAAGALIQLARGWPVEPALVTLAWISALPLILFALLAIAIQIVSPQKYAGMLFVVTLALIAVAGQPLGLEHPLLRFSSSSAVRYSGMSGFDGLDGFHGYMVFWSAITALAIVVTASGWRDRALLLKMSRGSHVAAVLLAIVAIVTGASLFAKTDFLSSNEQIALSVAYERQYRPLAAWPQPRIEALTANVELFPNEHRFLTSGAYTLANHTSRTIERIIVSAPPDAEASLRIDGAQRIAYDARFRQSIFAIALAPGARTTLHFDVAYTRKGFNTGDLAIVPNGSYLATTRLFPSLGYRLGLEIYDQRERRRQGLPPRDPEAEGDVPRADWIDLDLHVTTARDQRVVAPGQLLTQEDRGGGRRRFHFRSDAPIANQFVVASARYAVARANENGVAIEVSYDPAHAQNVERILRAARESLRLFRTSYGPYRYAQLRVAEVPAWWNFGGFAGPGEIFLSEQRALLIDARDPRRLDLVYRRVAHEVAHQWWGHNVVAARAPGALLLVESLTKYSELLALEKAYGRDAVGQSLQTELDLYLSGRTAERGAEPPLTRMEGQSYLYYRKGSIVMFAIKDLIGEEAVNAALRALLAERGGPNRQPTVADFVRHLPKHPLIDEWLNDVVLYDLKLDAARARRLPDGRYEVTLQIAASKSRDDGTVLPMREAIDVSITAADGSSLYLRKHELVSGPQQLAVIVDREPAHAELDPYVTRIDRNRFDQQRRVDIKP